MYSKCSSSADTHPLLCAGLQELRSRVLALRAFNLETLLIGEHVKSREPGIIQIRSVPGAGSTVSLPPHHHPGHAKCSMRKMTMLYPFCSCHEAVS
jgi:hypothetical protein